MSFRRHTPAALPRMGLAEQAARRAVDALAVAREAIEALRDEVEGMTK